MVMDGKGWHSATPKGLITTRWRVMVCIYIICIYHIYYIYKYHVFGGAWVASHIFRSAQVIRLCFNYSILKQGQNIKQPETKALLPSCVYMQ